MAIPAANGLLVNAALVSCLLKLGGTGLFWEDVLGGSASPVAEARLLKVGLAWAAGS